MTFWCKTCEVEMDQSTCDFCGTTGLPSLAENSQAAPEPVGQAPKPAPNPDPPPPQQPPPAQADPLPLPKQRADPTPPPNQWQPPPKSTTRNDSSPPEEHPTETATAFPTPKPAPKTQSPNAHGVSAQYQRDAEWQHPPISNIEEQVIKWHEEGRKIIAVIGFFDSGKTFYVNRLRQTLKDKRGWDSHEEPQSRIGPTASGVGLIATEIKAPEANYVILDIAGESFYKGYHLTKVNARSTDTMKLDPRYLTVLALADAYMLVISAASLPLPNNTAKSEDERERQEATKTLIQNFTRIIGLIKATQERLANGESPKELITNGVTGEQVTEQFQKRTTCAKPLHVLYSLADAYYQRCKDNNFDLDPFLFSFKKFPALAQSIDEYFDFYRFDFLSAFPGQDGVEPNYNVTPHGSFQALNWVHQRLLCQSGKWGAFHRLFYGFVTTRTAIRLRHYIDPKFKQQYSQQSHANAGGDIDEL